MTGYRRVEPAFCRGCGVPWTPGSDACPACGEAMSRAPTQGGDPRATLKFKRALAATLLVISCVWGVLLWESDESSTFFVTAGSLASVIAVVTAPLWYPKATQVLLVAGRPVAWLLGGGLGLGLAYVHDALDVLADMPLLVDIGWWEPGASLILVLGVRLVTIVAEEALFRGLLFDAVTGIGTRGSAVVASALLFGVCVLYPPMAVIGLVAAVLRAWSGSIVPGIAMRSTLALLAFVSMVY